VQLEGVGPLDEGGRDAQDGSYRGKESVGAKEGGHPLTGLLRSLKG